MAPTYETAYDSDRDLGSISMIDPAGTAVKARQDIQFQNGTIPENGINGVTNEAVLDLLAMRIRALNQKFPCRENSIAITKIEEARLWLQERTRVREDQGVEGKMKIDTTDELLIGGDSSLSHRAPPTADQMQEASSA